MNSDLTLTAFHGTVRQNVGSIQSGGLRPYRRRKLVYVTFDFERAVHYARCWAVGLHLAEDIDEPAGAVIKVLLPTDQPILTGRPDEAAIHGGLPPDAIGDVTLIDCGGLDDVTRVGLVVHLLRIIRCGNDPPRRDMWHGVVKKLKAHLARFPSEFVRESAQRLPKV